MHNKVAIITGAAAGIGRSCAIRFAREDYNVLVTDLDHGGGSDTCAEIVDQGGTALFHTGDISDPATSDAAASLAVEKWGRLDALVANAGVQTEGSLLETTNEDWTRILDVNLRGVANACKAALPLMLTAGSGAIVITSSVNALVGSPGMAAYDASKAAVLGLMRNLAAEHGGRGIRVNAVCPGDTLTGYHVNRFAARGVSIEQLRNMTSDYGALGRAAEPEEIAAAIYFLASDDASFITGQALAVDGGYSVTG